MSKFTPGLWEIKRLSKSESFIRAIIFSKEKSGKFISEYSIAHIREENLGTDEAMANAHLIAAAPKLLEVCKFLTSKYGEAQKKSIQLGGKLGIYLSLEEINKFEQAIAKAEGK